MDWLIPDEVWHAVTFVVVMAGIRVAWPMLKEVAAFLIRLAADRTDHD